MRGSMPIGRCLYWTGEATGFELGLPLSCALEQYPAHGFPRLGFAGARRKLKYLVGVEWICELHGFAL